MKSPEEIRKKAIALGITEATSMQTCEDVETERELIRLAVREALDDVMSKLADRLDSQTYMTIRQEFLVHFKDYLT